MLSGLLLLFNTKNDGKMRSYRDIMTGTIVMILQLIVGATLVNVTLEHDDLPSPSLPVLELF